MEVKIDDLTDPRVIGFLDDHVEEMKGVSPPESKHALDVDSLKKPDITFWSVWDQGELIGCGAIKELDNLHGEVKSMRTLARKRQSGIGSVLLKHIIDEAQDRGYNRLSLETGSMTFFEPARKLYQKFGFDYCPPFSSYKEDPSSVFMTLTL